MPFYDASPGMIDDIPKAEAPAPAPAPAPGAKPAPAPPAPTYVDNLSAPPASPADAAEVKARSTLVDKLAAQADAMPHGSEVGVSLTRAAEGSGLMGDAAAAVASEWADTFKAHGIAATDAMQLVDIGASIHRNGPPDEATEAVWLSEVVEGLRREFGSPEAAERAADLAGAWVARDPRLLAWLEATRLGSHPRVVLALAKAAHTAHKAGKWKPK